MTSFSIHELVLAKNRLSWINFILDVNCNVGTLADILQIEIENIFNKNIFPK